jgi:hypothetical protein
VSEFELEARVWQDRLDYGPSQRQVDLMLMAGILLIPLYWVVETAETILDRVRRGGPRNW